MNPHEPDEVRRELGAQLLDSMIDQQARLAAELRERLEAIEHPEVRLVAEQLAGQTLDRYRWFCRRSQRQLLAPEDSVIVVDQLPEPVRPATRARWTRLLRWPWRRTGNVRASDETPARDS